jgi:hypothetical protein
MHRLTRRALLIFLLLAFSIHLTAQEPAFGGAPGRGARTDQAAAAAAAIAGAKEDPAAVDRGPGSTPPTAPAAGVLPGGAARPTVRSLVVLDDEADPHRTGSAQRPSRSGNAKSTSVRRRSSHRFCSDGAAVIVVRIRTPPAMRGEAGSIRRATSATPPGVWGALEPGTILFLCRDAGCARRQGGVSRRARRGSLTRRGYGDGDAALGAVLLRHAGPRRRFQRLPSRCRGRSFFRAKLVPKSKFAIR